MVDSFVHIPIDERVMNQHELFSEDLKSLVGTHLELSINDNRSTMLSVRWEPQKTKVSLHRMFLQAPLHVRNELARYLRRRKRQVPPTIKAFIHEKVASLDYSQDIQEDRLSSKGRFFDLKMVYNKLNRDYFNSRLKLLVTWHGTHTPQNHSQCCLGLFYDALRLIKVHRLLDAASVPEYVVQFIVYHEMVHAACPAYVDSRGINRIHSPEFKRQERRFKHYAEATKWLQDNKKNFFILT